MPKKLGSILWHQKGIIFDDHTRRLYTGTYMYMYLRKKYITMTFKW
jgi:hypothetical protein